MIRVVAHPPKANKVANPIAQRSKALKCKPESGILLKTHQLETGQGSCSEFFGIKSFVAFCVWKSSGFDIFKVMALGVHQMRGNNVLKRGKHAFYATGVLFFPIAQHVANLLTLQVLLAAAQCAGNDGECAVRSPAGQVFFSHIGQGANHDVATVVTDQFWGHAFELAAKKHIEKKRLQHIVTVVT
jgi:hypothetical protein